MTTFFADLNSQPRAPMTILKNYPETAKQIGLVMADYAILETRMLSIFTAFNDATHLESMEAFYSEKNVHQRRRKIMKAFNTSDERLKKTLKELWERFHIAAQQRAIVAHCSVYAHDAGPMGMIMVGGKPEYRALDVEFFNQTFDLFHRLSDDLTLFLGLIADLRPNGFNKVLSLPFSPREPIDQDELLRGVTEKEINDLYPNLEARIIDLGLWDWLLDKARVNQATSSMGLAFIPINEVSFGKLIIKKP